MNEHFAIYYNIMSTNGEYYKSVTVYVLHVLPLLNCKTPFTSEPTLTLRAMMTATEGVEMPMGSNHDGYLDMPDDVYNEIMLEHGIDGERKA